MHVRVLWGSGSQEKRGCVGKETGDLRVDTRGREGSTESWALTPPSDTHAQQEGPSRYLEG